MKRYLWALPLAATCILVCGTVWAADVATIPTVATKASWLVLGSVLIASIRTALSNDTVKLPTRAAPARALIVAGLAALGSFVDLIAGGATIGVALGTFAALGLPSLAQELIKWMAGADKGSGDSSASAPKAASTGMPSMWPPPALGKGARMVGGGDISRVCHADKVIGLTGRTVPTIAVFAALALLVPGCASLKNVTNDAKTVVKDVAAEIATDAQDAKAIVDALHSTSAIFFLLHPDAAAQAKVEQAFVDVNLAIDAAIRAAEGADAAAHQDYNAAFASFRQAYSNVVKVLTDLGVVSMKLSSDRMSVARGGGGITDMPIPRAATEHK